MSKFDNDRIDLIIIGLLTPLNSHRYYRSSTMARLVSSRLKKHSNKSGYRGLMAICSPSENRGNMSLIYEAFTGNALK